MLTAKGGVDTILHHDDYYLSILVGVGCEKYTKTSTKPIKSDSRVFRVQDLEPAPSHVVL